MTTAQDFIDRYDSQIFNRSDELLKGLRDGSIHLESTSLESRQLSSAYLDIYQFRLERLKQKPSSDHARAMAADVEDLCIHLEQHPESPIDLWIFSQSPHFSYSVFVTRELRLVAGCIRELMRDRFLKASLPNFEAATLLLTKIHPTKTYANQGCSDKSKGWLKNAALSQ